VVLRTEGWRDGGAGAADRPFGRDRKGKDGIPFALNREEKKEPLALSLLNHQPRGPEGLGRGYEVEEGISL